MTTIAIRRANRFADFHAFHDLLLEYEADLPSVLRHGSVPDPGRLRASYVRRNAAFIAAAATQSAGCVAVRALDAETAVILRLFVRPAYRGAGAARALVTRAIRFLKNAGYARVVLDTDKERLRAAYQLYQSLGFTECEPYGPTAYPHATFMERPVHLRL
jgi:GNAT superfamily N-acetyltransferase